MDFIYRKDSLLWAWILSVVVTLVVILWRPEFHNWQRSRKQLNQYEQRLEKLRAENALLKSSLEQIKGKNELIYEIMARQRGMQMANERVYVFQEPKQK